MKKWMVWLEKRKRERMLLQRLLRLGLGCNLSFLQDPLRGGKGEKGEQLGKEMKNALLGAVWNAVIATRRPPRSSA